MDIELNNYSAQVGPLTWICRNCRYSFQDSNNDIYAPVKCPKCGYQIKNRSTVVIDNIEYEIYPEGIRNDRVK